jgi:hypothetical protein
MAEYLTAIFSVFVSNVFPSRTGRTAFKPAFITHFFFSNTVTIIFAFGKTSCKPKG